MRLASVAPLWIAVLAVAALLVSSGALAAAPASSRGNDGDWTTDGHDYNAQRYSPLDRINERNVKSLGLAWFYDLGHRTRRDPGS